jgi:uncharacterized protein YcfJ
MVPCIAGRDAMEEAMKRAMIVLGLALGLAVAGAAGAQPYRGDAGAHDEPGLDWARVVRVDPIIETYEEPVSRNVCWDEPVEYVEPRYAYRQGGGDGTGGALLGAIIGGALGNQVGKGDGRDAATIAGAVIGGSVGYNRATRGGYQQVGQTVRRGSERVCDTRVDYRRREQVTGYDVTYEYLGRTYQTQTAAHPGDRIRVAVSVEPVF